MHLGALIIPAVIPRATTAATREYDAQGRIIWREGGGAIPIAALEEIGVTATRDYLPAVIMGLIALYVFTDRKRG